MAAAAVLDAGLHARLALAPLGDPGGLALEATRATDLGVLALVVGT